MKLEIIVIIGGLAIVLIVVSILWLRASARFRHTYNKYKDVMEVEVEVEKWNGIVASLESKVTRLESNFNNKNQSLNKEYQEKLALFNELKSELELFQEELEITSFGIYEPHYDFDTPEKYKESLAAIRKVQKDLIRNKAATVCSTNVTVDGSKRKGMKMVNRNIKLMLRAFNGDCDSIISGTRWNNVARMEDRIIKSFDTINKIGESNYISVTEGYLNLKLQELHFAHEYKEKLKQAKDEQRRIREAMREEERARKEIEKAKQEAEAEENRFQKALEKAREDVGKATGDKLEKLNSQIDQLEQQLKNAHEQKERAVSRAQITKSGHIYVISNIGSFGKDVYKIGMTRRLEPLDRVKELGDASVPFAFDVHAMIYSENAPELENSLHKKFDGNRFNLVNTRKEFFRVSLEDIESAVNGNHGKIQFTKLAEARDYRETLSMIEQKRQAAEKKLNEAERFPESL